MGDRAGGEVRPRRRAAERSGSPADDRQPLSRTLAPNFSPRGGFAWDITGDGRTSLRGGYGLYFNTNNQQNLIVTITNPPFTPRPVIANPTFPNPPFDRAGATSIRPMQFDLEYPRVQVWNVSVQRELPWQTVATVSYAGSRGRHLLRSNDVNTATADHPARRRRRSSRPARRGRTPRSRRSS